jgi:hypothetical protein
MTVLILVLLYRGCPSRTVQENFRTQGVSAGFYLFEVLSHVQGNAIVFLIIGNQRNDDSFRFPGALFWGNTPIQEECTTLCEEQNRDAKGPVFNCGVARFTDFILRINKLDLNSPFRRCMFDPTYRSNTQRVRMHPKRSRK